MSALPPSSNLPVSTSIYNLELPTEEKSLKKVPHPVRTSVISRIARVAIDAVTRAATAVRNFIGTVGTALSTVPTTIKTMLGMGANHEVVKTSKKVNQFVLKGETSQSNSDIQNEINSPVEQAIPALRENQKQVKEFIIESYAKLIMLIEKYAIDYDEENSSEFDQLNKFQREKEEIVGTILDIEEQILLDEITSKKYEDYEHRFLELQSKVNDLQNEYFRLKRVLSLNPPKISEFTSLENEVSPSLMASSFANSNHTIQKANEIFTHSIESSELIEKLQDLKRKFQEFNSINQVENEEYYHLWNESENLFMVAQKAEDTQNFSLLKENVNGLESNYRQLQRLTAPVSSQLQALNTIYLNDDITRYTNENVELRFRKKIDEIKKGRVFIQDLKEFELNETVKKQALSLVKTLSLEDAPIQLIIKNLAEKLGRSATPSEIEAKLYSLALRLHLETVTNVEGEASREWFWSKNNKLAPHYRLFGATATLQKKINYSPHLAVKGQNKKINLIYFDAIGKGSYNTAFKVKSLSGEELVARDLTQQTSIDQSRAAYHLWFSEADLHRHLMQKIPGIVQVHAIYGGSPAQAGMLMEKCDGDLSQLDISTLTAHDRSLIARQLIATLISMHQEGYVHNDIKLSNVFFKKGKSGEYITKVADFGMITQIGAPARGYSPMYRAPEQWLSTTVVNEQNDAWALGLMLFELKFGKLIQTHQGFISAFNRIYATDKDRNAILKNLPLIADPNFKGTVITGKLSKYRNDQEIAKILEDIKTLTDSELIKIEVNRIFDILLKRQFVNLQKQISNLINQNCNPFDAYDEGIVALLQSNPDRRMSLEKVLNRI